MEPYLSSYTKTAPNEESASEVIEDGLHIKYINLPVYDTIQIYWRTMYNVPLNTTVMESC